jgi:hypothetical protein
MHVKDKQEDHPKKVVAVIGAGPAGMTVALMLSKAGHQVKLYEAGKEVGGLWSVKLSEEGHYQCENSCKVYQGGYNTAPALFEMIGTKWQNHFVSRYNLKKDWLQPFLKDCKNSDIFHLSKTFVANALRMKSYRKISVEEYLLKHKISEGCQNWLRATALGGITGTLKMSMWEVGHRFSANIYSIYKTKYYTLFWNKEPPNAAGGFISIWKKVLIDNGVEIYTNSPIQKLDAESNAPRVVIGLEDGASQQVDAIFLTIPPPPLATLLTNSSASIIKGFGHSVDSFKTMMGESIYQHLGIAWFFDEPLPDSYPLAGYNVRKGWYPILVPFSQYQPHLKPHHKAVIVGSVSLVTGFTHPRFGKLATAFSHEEIAKILWEDERAVNPDLPEPVDVHIFGVSSATQIVHHGTLPLKPKDLPIYIGTNINGQAPYFTSSLEAAIQAGYAAAKAFEPNIEYLPIKA